MNSNNVVDFPTTSGDLFTAKERRKHPRKTDFKAYAVFVLPTVGGKTKRLRKEIVNISSGGVCIQTHGLVTMLGSKQKYHVAIVLTYSEKVIMLYNMNAKPIWNNKEKGLTGFSMTRKIKKDGETNNG